jgi:hypothetical protein
MKQHERRDRGYMGIVILAVLAIFAILHFALPGVTLWPAALVSLVVATMVVSHVQGGRHCSRRMAQPSPDNRD